MHRSCQRLYAMLSEELSAIIVWASMRAIDVIFSQSRGKIARLIILIGFVLVLHWFLILSHLASEAPHHDEQQHHATRINEHQTEKNKRRLKKDRHLIKNELYFTFEKSYKTIKEYILNPTSPSLHTIIELSQYYFKHFKDNI